jgi:hypothetical protein
MRDRRLKVEGWRSEVGGRRQIKDRKVGSWEDERVGRWEAMEGGIGNAECGKERRCEYWRSEVGWLDD